MNAIRSLLAVAAVLVLVSCSTAVEDQPEFPADSEGDAGRLSPPQERVLSGMLVMGPEVRTLKPCTEQTELWVIPVESVQRAYDEVAEEAYQPVFVEVEGVREASPAAGFGADYSGQLRLVALLRAESAEEGFGCGEELTDVLFKASGQAPFWHLRVFTEQIMLATPDIPQTIFLGVRPTPLESGWRFESLSTGPETVQLRLDLTRERCSDAMTGSVYTWIATLDIGGEVRRGCGWEGELAPGRR